MMLRHEPTLIATTGYQMTASSPRGTFSQAELTAERVITRCITRSYNAGGGQLADAITNGDQGQAVEAAPVPKAIEPPVAKVIHGAIEAADV
jgi:hypothetical protein